MKTGNLLFGRYKKNLIKGRSLESVLNVLKYPDTFMVQSNLSSVTLQKGGGGEKYGRIRQEVAEYRFTESIQLHAVWQFLVKYYVTNLNISKPYNLLQQNLGQHSIIQLLLITLKVYFTY